MTQLAPAILADVARDLAGIDVLPDAPMARRTTFGIGGPADLFVTAVDAEQVRRVLAAAERHGVPMFVLGGGSNLLVADRGIRGLVLHLSGTLAELSVESRGHAIRVGAGCSYPRLTRTALDLGWRSAGGWLGTPGQVGGALLMNAGSKNGEIGDVVVWVEGVTAAGPERFSREACAFGYRTSIFQAKARQSLNPVIIEANSVSSRQMESPLVLTSTFLQCDNSKREDAAELDRIAKELLARRHQTQPKLRSAGSIFKNPPGDFAGRLIEAAGLKGFSVGNASISDVHANFIVNKGGATAADVIAVAEHAAHQVLSKFGVALEWEVRRVGDFT